MRYLIIFILTVFVHSSPDISTYGCPNPEDYGYSYVSGTVDISPDGSVYDCSSSFTPSCTSSQTTYGDYEVWTLSVGGKLRGDEYSSNGKCRVTASDISGLIEYRKCNRPDQPLDLLPGENILFPIEAESTPGACPVPLTSSQNECVAQGGVIKSSLSNCCASYFCVSSQNNNNCAPDEHYDNAQEACVCNNGYPKINGQCQVPHCPDPDDATNYPLRFENISESACSESTLDEHQYVYKVYQDVNLSCCYIDPLYTDNNDNNTSHECPVGYYYSSFYEECRPLDADNNDSDNNTTSHDCPMEYYYSIETEKCEPFYPENNSTDNNTTGNSSDNSDSNDSEGVGSNDDLEDLLDDLNQTINQNHDDDLASITDSFEGLKETIDQAMDGYVSNYESLQDVISGTAVPRSNLHGSCHLEVTVFHRKVDLSQGFIKFAPIARPVIMLFMNIYLTLILLRVALWAYRDVSQKILIMFGH